MGDVCGYRMMAGTALYIKTNDGIQIKIGKHISSDSYKQNDLQVLSMVYHLLQKSLKSILISNN